MKNATMIRRASELDVGSRVILGGEIRTVVAVFDHKAGSIGIQLDNGGAIVDKASALYTCACASE